MKTNPIPKLRTTRIAATELGQPLHKVLYLLSTRPDIQPVAFAGRTRLFDRAALARLRDELEAIRKKHPNEQRRLKRRGGAPHAK